jgi:hypothetical protein
MRKTVEVEVFEVAGFVMYRGLLADPQFEGLLFGQNLDGSPTQRRFVPLEAFEKVAKRLAEMEAEKAAAKAPASQVVMEVNPLPVPDNDSWFKAP